MHRGPSSPRWQDTGVDRAPLSMAKLIRLKVSSNTPKLTQRQVFHQSQSRKTISCAMSKETPAHHVMVELMKELAGLPVLAWMKQHSSWDAVTPENVSVDPREDEGRGCRDTEDTLTRIMLDGSCTTQESEWEERQKTQSRRTNDQ